MEEGDLRRILSLFEMANRAGTQDDDAIRNEAASAFVALTKLLARYGLDLKDINKLSEMMAEIYSEEDFKLGCGCRA